MPRVTNPVETLFISDLHLSQQRPQITQLFYRFLLDRATRAKALYILGDLFEVWLGDDMVLAEDQETLSHLRQLSDQDIPIFIMHGNRDFLIGQTFMDLTGCQPLPDPSIIDLYGTQTLLMHGDTLCTDDVDYQRFRAMVRDPNQQAEFLARTPQQRITLAKQYRTMSKSETSMKADDIMDVNQRAVEQTMQNADVLQLIHGHTHRPAVHKFTLNGSSACRIVLNDWYDHGSVLVCNDQGYKVERLD